MNKFNIPEFRFPRANLPYSIALQPGSSSGTEYVQEGLIFQLDCDDVVDGATSFKSKKGLEYEPITFDRFMDKENQQLPSVSKGERGLITYGMFADKAIPEDVFLNNDISFEVSIIDKGISSGVDNGDVSIVLAEADRLYSFFSIALFEAEVGFDITSRLVKDSVNTISMVLRADGGVSIYVNGVEVPRPNSRMAKSASAQSPLPLIEGMTAIASYGTELLNVRIYKDALSVSDLANNYRYDKKKYQPPVPENALVDNGSYLVDGGYFVVDNN